MSNSTDTLERLARIETIVTRLEDRLLGGDQPGEIDKIKDRVTYLERVEQLARGALVTISGILTAISAAFISHIFKKL